MNILHSALRNCIGRVRFADSANAPHAASLQTAGQACHSAPEPMHVGNTTSTTCGLGANLSKLMAEALRVRVGSSLEDQQADPHVEVYGNIFPTPKGF